MASSEATGRSGAGVARVAFVITKSKSVVGMCGSGVIWSAAGAWPRLALTGAIR